MLNDGAYVAQTAALAAGNNNMALYPFARLLQANWLLGVGAEILWHPGLGASYGIGWARSKKDQRRGYRLWATSSCTSGTE